MNNLGVCVDAAIVIGLGDASHWVVGQSVPPRYLLSFVKW